MITMAYQHTQLYPPHRPRSISDTPVHLTVVTPPAYHRMNTFFAGQPQPSPPYSATDPMHTAIRETHDSSYIDKSVQHLHEQSQQPVFRYSSTIPLRPTPLHTNPHHPIISNATTTTVPPPSSYQLPPIMAPTNAMTTTTATATATADVPVTMTTTAGSMTEPHATVAAATTMTSQPLKASSSAKRGTDGFLLFRADQRKMYPDEKASEASLDQRWRDLPEMHKKEYHQRAIIINSRMEEEEELRHKRSFREMDAADKPNASRRPRLEHLVSPEAIRTAEIEEQEEAMGKSERRPFSGFPSFMYMKYMRERETGNQTNPNEEQERMDYGAEENQVEQIEHVEGEEDDASYDSGDDNDDMSVDNDGYSPSQSTSSPGHLPMPSDELPTTSTALSSKSRINMASHLGAAEFDALASLDDISSRTEGGEASSKSNNGSSSSSTTITTNKERLKRPPNGYLLFNRDMRRKLLEISPKMTVAEISKEIGERWKNLPPEQKESYMLQAARIKQDHLRNHPDFIYTRRSKAQLEEARRLSKSRRTSKASLQASGSSSSDPADPTSRTVRRRKSGAPDAPRDPRGRKKKRHKHPKAPKHPMSGFLFFLAAVRPEVARQFPGSTVGPISKIIASQWREMTDEARIPWLQKAEEDKARYAREMQEYNASLEAAAAAAQENKEENEEDDMDDRTVQTVVQMVNSTTTKVPLNDDMEPAVALNGGAAAANTNNTTTINNNSTSYYSPEPVDPFLSSL